MSKASKLSFIDCTMGCSTLVELASKKVPSFCFPEVFVFVVGDVRTASATVKKISSAMQPASILQNLYFHRRICA
jgi:hypothetical protein